jgi:ribosomal protein S18 acetylase RimI-like enzyme
VDPAALTVRTAQTSDLDGVSTLLAQVNAFHAALLPDYIAIVEPPFERGEFAEALDASDQVVLVAEAGGEIVGVAWAGIKSAAAMPFLVRRRYAYVMDISVDEGHRGEGVGRTLMDEIADWARGKGVRDIELNVWEDNRQAISFYESLGFERLDIRMTKRV